MFTPWLTEALARAFVAGDADPAAIKDRASRVLGHPWQWLGPLVLRYKNAFATGTRPRHRDVIRFLKDDQGFTQAVERHWHSLELADLLLESQTMQPVAAAKPWNLPPLETVAALEEFLNLAGPELEWFADLATLNSRARKTNLRHYNYRVLQKDSTNIRLIEAPKPRLKQLQRVILSHILELIPPHPAVHGFQKGRSIRTFAAPHIGQHVVLKMDLQDFFPGICGPRIQSLFRTFGYPESVADLLGGICTTITPRDIWPAATPWTAQLIYRQPHLPQGAPTSPGLANLCTYHLDCRLTGLAEASGATYSRYADDLAFSGDESFAHRAERFSIHVAAIAGDEGFTVHHRKTRIMRRSVRQHIAGLVINERHNIRRTDFDQLKAILTNCIRSGPSAQNRNGHPDFRAHLQGRVAFVKSIHPAKAAKLEKLLAQIYWNN